MTHTLIIAPQWIGDAVMTEPLLRRLHARGERLTVGALPWVAPVYRAMPQVADVIEFPFAHGGLQFKARRSMAKRLAFLSTKTRDQAVKGPSVNVCQSGCSARKARTRSAWPLAMVRRSCSAGVSSWGRLGIPRV